MNAVYRDIFRAIHEGRWISIEYKNKDEKITRYWIGVRDLDIHKKILVADGLHLGQYTVRELTIYMECILTSKIIEGSYCPVNHKLIQDIHLNPYKYKKIFDNIANLKILNYLEMCNRMDTVPYNSDFELVHFLDRESFCMDSETLHMFYELSIEQFRSIVKNFQYKAENDEKRKGKLIIQQLGMNVLSIHTNKGLYVLAYRKLELDVKNRVLRPEEEITVCTEYTLNGVKESIRKFLDAEDYELLKDFEKNQEKIKDCITRRSSHIIGVDDMPYVIGLGMDIVLDLHKEYKSIIDMFHSDKVTVPIKAFFGDLLSRPVRSKAYPIMLADHKINMDQLLAINNAMKYPLAYIQGPPGTGKTNTIINTIVTAFFNEKTVLFSSYNNQPIDGVFEKLSSMKYHGKRIMFPIIRFGNAEKVKEALQYMKDLYNQAKTMTVFEATLDRRKEDRIERAKKLASVLKRYEELLDLKERRETLNRVLEYEEQRKASMQMLPFQADLSGRQMNMINKKINGTKTVTEEEAVALLEDNENELKKYLYFTSARYIKKIDDARNADLKAILMESDEDVRLESFTHYLSKKENVKKLQKIFPVVATTCISAHKLGEPAPMFDMVIMDEASQCNTAVSLVPIIRGENLMLVGDPQQLNPVILLDELTNNTLKKRYSVADEYDYRQNSIYKTYLACDAVSDEILLHNHYRCNKKIIDFNNKKYYNSKLQILTQSDEKQPLVYIDIKDSSSTQKNTAPAEADEIIRYAIEHKDKSIGVITPFVNQKNAIESEINKNNLKNVTCGTVHAFQGDEKDIVLFSTAITDNTQTGTYEWLKNNKELINVATSRAKERLIVLSSMKNLERLRNKNDKDDLYELVEYVRTNGTSEVTHKRANSRALGVKPFSSAMEEAFLENLNHALENIWLSQNRFIVHKEVAIAHIFSENISSSDLFYSGRFDFVVYESMEGQEIPVLAIELDGKEHYEDEVVKQRDKKKNEICKKHNLQLIRVENAYARRYNHIKEILISYFGVQKR